MEVFFTKIPKEWELDITLREAVKTMKNYVSDTMMRKYRKKALIELEEYCHRKELEVIEYMLN